MAFDRCVQNKISLIFLLRYVSEDGFIIRRKRLVHRKRKGSPPRRELLRAGTCGDSGMPSIAAKTSNPATPNRSHRDTQLSAGRVEGDPIRSRPRTFSKGNSNPAIASS